MSIDYESIGKYACEKAEEYHTLVREHVNLVKERHEIDGKIAKAEAKGDTKSLEPLYKEFREIHAMQSSNRCYRQKFCDDFLSKISEMMEK